MKQDEEIRVIGREQEASQMRGFSLPEILIVIGIMGILMLVSYPSVMNSLETRDLENQVREIQTTFQQAKFLAVREKINHGVFFLRPSNPPSNPSENWQYVIEREGTPGNWSEIPRAFRKTIPNKYVVTVNLPNHAIIYTPIGFVLDYNSFLCSVSVQSPKIAAAKGSECTRFVTIYGGGSCKITK